MKEGGGWVRGGEVRTEAEVGAEPLLALRVEEGHKPGMQAALGAGDLGTDSSLEPPGDPRLLTHDLTP